MEEITDELERLEEDLESDDSSSESPPSDIVAFNELRSCSDLVRMYASNQLIIKPDFQRDVVWTNPAQTRCIDSLVKQLPIPSMCLSLDYKTEKRLMIDGLQRIWSIIRFITDKSWRLSKLADIDSRISGKTSEFIQNKHPEIYTRIENLTIPITVLRCDYSKKAHMRYLFTIFHRLNTGGNKLSNQEIRNCIYQSPFNDLLKDITNHVTTISLLDIDPKKTYRFSFEELFLRIFAFSSKISEYNGKLAKFLNDYMYSLRKRDDDDLEEQRERMIRTIELLYQKILSGQQLPRLSKATTEAIFIGIYSNIETLETEPSRDLKRRLKELRTDPHFSVDSLKEGLSATEKVKSRTSRAIEIFS